jgi:type VI protein secretion system component VasK
MDKMSVRSKSKRPIWPFDKKGDVRMQRFITVMHAIIVATAVTAQYQEIISKTESVWIILISFIIALTLKLLIYWRRRKCNVIKNNE